MITVLDPEGIERDVRGRRPATSDRGGSLSLLHSNTIDALLCFGVLALALYIAMDALAALRYEGYSYRHQTISELSAVGAPTRSLWLWLTVPYELLVLGFAVGALAVANGRWRHKLVGASLLGYALVGIAWPFAPMHQREVLAAGGETFSDTMHLVLAGVTSGLFLLMMAAGWRAFGRRFQWYTIATVALLLVFGMLVAAEADDVGKNASTPWVGAWERLNVFGAMLWMAVFGLGALFDRRRNVLPPA